MQYPAYPNIQTNKRESCTQQLRNRRAAFNSAVRNLKRNGIEFKTTSNYISNGVSKCEDSKKNKTINTTNIENNVKLPENLTASLLSNVLSIAQTTDICNRQKLYCFACWYKIAMVIQLHGINL